jgi:hypothetical protein
MGADLVLMKNIGSNSIRDSSIPGQCDEQGRQIVQATLGQPGFWEVTLGLAGGGPYAAGDTLARVVGLLGGLNSATIFKVGHWIAYLNQIRVSDAANQKAELNLLFFDVAPVSSTLTDNAAFAWSGTEYTRLIAMARILPSDYVTINNRAFATLSGLNICLNTILGNEISPLGSVYMACVIQSAASYADGDVRIRMQYQLQSCMALNGGNFN